MFQPGLTGTNTGTNNNAGRLSPLFGMLPFLDQSNLFSAIQSGAGDNQGTNPWTSRQWWDQDIVAFQCPSDTLHDRDRGKTSYVVNKGDRATELENREQERNRGVFGGQYGVGVRIRDIVDGTSNTIAISETRRSVAYGGDDLEVYGQARINTAGVEPNPSLCIAALDPANKARFAAGSNGERVRGDRWGDGRPAFTGFQTILPPNSPSCIAGGNNEDPNNAIYSASSAHTGRVQVLMCDGTVRFVSENIDTGNITAVPPVRATTPSPYGVWGALGTRGCGETIGEW
jgi:hypothetical protein